MRREYAKLAYRRIFSIASRIWRTRNVQILSGDTHRLSENGVSDRRKDRIAQDDIDARGIEHFFEAKAKGDELKQCQCVRDIYENINVTVRTCNVASGRPE